MAFMEENVAVFAGCLGWPVEDVVMVRDYGRFGLLNVKTLECRYWRLRQIAIPELMGGFRYELEPVDVCQPTA
jgi:hypothetical protein